jgi:ABC-type nitrate/sulfonate/bicarbonate transport system substrate-binding protein
MKTVRIALDWTPNINHIGFFVAREMDFYKEEGLQVELLDPSSDNYELTPAKKVELGQADMALCPFESLISYQTKKLPFDAVAIAALFQEDLSAIVVLGDSDIQRPCDLDGRSYASYKARYEDEIVRQMIQNDGGKGELILAYPEKLGIWDTLLSKKYDSTWIFTNWEGVQAAQRNAKLRSFKLSDYGIPYGYSPVIMASRGAVETQNETYAAFLRASKNGFLYALNNPENAISVLSPFVSATDKDIDLLKSQEESAMAYGQEKQWGKIEKRRVDEFLEWLKKTKLETATLSYEDLVYDILNF